MLGAACGCLTAAFAQRHTAHKRSTVLSRLPRRKKGHGVPISLRSEKEHVRLELGGVCYGGLLKEFLRFSVGP